MLQAYLTGRQLPSLYVTYYWEGNPTLQHVSVLAAPLEAAVQQVVANPTLARPRVSSGDTPSISKLHLAPPVGQVQFVEPEVEQWIEAGGIERLHAAYHKVRPGPNLSMPHSMRNQT